MSDLRRHGNVKDIVGRRFGRLVVTAFAGRTKGRKSRWKCLCDCGKSKVIVRSSLTSGHSKSCGCIHAKANGEARNGNQTPEYAAWAEMKRRCENHNNPGWANYGGRGIKIYEQWRSNYPAFLAAVGRRPSPMHSLDRINNDGNYEPGNVRWATATMQQSNRRKPQKRNWHQAAKRAYDVVQTFEDVIASYAGAPYAVTVESCTAALLLCCVYLKVKEVEIPRFTYCSVPMSIRHAGGTVKFRDEDWSGVYQLAPYPIYDAARLFTSGMYRAGSFICLSFHWAKHLPIGRGGAILCDDRKAVEWFKRARFDGRTEGRPPKTDRGLMVGWHFYFTPPQAAQGLMLMASIAEHNKPLPNSDYPDLSEMDIFK